MRNLIIASKFLKTSFYNYWELLPELLVELLAEILNWCKRNRSDIAGYLLIAAVDSFLVLETEYVKGFFSFCFLILNRWNLNNK